MPFTEMGQPKKEQVRMGEDPGIRVLTMYMLIQVLDVQVQSSGPDV